MNFTLHFNLYKKELCEKVSNNNLDQIEMAILDKQPQGNSGSIKDSIDNKEKDKEIVKLLVNKHYDQYVDKGVFTE